MFLKIEEFVWILPNANVFGCKFAGTASSNEWVK